MSAQMNSALCALRRLITPWFFTARVKSTTIFHCATRRKAVLQFTQASRLDLTRRALNVSLTRRGEASQEMHGRNVDEPKSNDRKIEPEFYCTQCAEPVLDPLTCRDCASLICRKCGTPLERIDELGIG